jgi:hypothetical protein
MAQLAIAWRSVNAGNIQLRNRVRDEDRKEITYRDRLICP